jgi:hypothetical protein
VEAPTTQERAAATRGKLRRCVSALCRWVGRLLSRAEPVTLLIIHELALHHIAVGARLSESSVSPSSFPNALPFLFDERAIERAVMHLEDSTQSERVETTQWSAPANHFLPPAIEGSETRE